MPRLDIWARQFYDTRSQIVHEGYAQQLRFVATDSRKVSEGPLYQSLLSYGRQVFQLCLGTPHASPATAEILTVMKHLLPENANWSAFGISRFEFAIVAQAASQGGNCRVGLEDNLYLNKGEFASNLLLVERALRIIRELGREPATAAQAAERLGIKRF